jgi:hypothetical protein
VLLPEAVEASRAEGQPYRAIRAGVLAAWTAAQDSPVVMVATNRILRNNPAMSSPRQVLRHGCHLQQG